MFRTSSRSTAAGGKGSVPLVAKVEVYNGNLDNESRTLRTITQAPGAAAWWSSRGYPSSGIPGPVGNGEVCPKIARVLVLAELGPSLEDLRVACGGRLDWSTVSYVCCQMIDCLEYVHSVGFTYGDVKPGNLVMGRGRPAAASEPFADASRAHLIDFGVASKWQQRSGLAFKADDPHVERVCIAGRFAG